MATDSSICLVSVGNDARVCAGDTELMKITIGDLYMGGEAIIGRIRFRSDGPLRIANLISPWLRFVPKRHPDQVRVSAEEIANGLRLHVAPDTRGGVADVEDSFDFLPDPQSGGWCIEHRCKIVLRRSIDVRQLGVVDMPDEHGRPGFYWEIDDPNFDGNYGPSVPMQNDWLGVYEPTCGPDTFRKHWRRKVERYLFCEPSGRVRSIRFHRGLLFCLPRQNGRALPIKAGGWAGVLHTDGAGTLYEFIDGEATFGHICEYFFDTHFWHRLAVDPARPILPKGHTLRMAYRMREVPSEAMRKLVHNARPIEPTESEWRNHADVPIYEEPVNHFRTSWREDNAGDAWPWVPVAGATWDRKVGRRQPGSLCLERVCKYAERISGGLWEVPRVGAHTLMNPLVPGARYRLSAFARTDRQILPPRQTPALSITLHKYAGPATFAPEIQPAAVFMGQARAPFEPGRWAKIEVISGPINGHVMGATLGCHFRGEGTAWFDEVRFEKLG